jgi:hypothetical protein
VSSDKYEHQGVAIFLGTRNTTLSGDREGAVSAFATGFRIPENDDAGLILEKLPNCLRTQTACAR